MRWRAALAVVVVAGSAVLIRTHLLETVSVSSDSMAPTVCSGDTVLLTRLHGADSVRINDIVTFANPQDGGDAIKRVIATAGQQVALRDAVLVVDGKPVDEPYVDHSSIDGVYFGPVVVPAGTVFVMGDHREVSIDSRTYGPIPTSALHGRLLWDWGSDCGS